MGRPKQGQGITPERKRRIQRLIARKHRIENILRRLSTRAIGKKYGVSRQTVSTIARGIK